MIRPLFQKTTISFQSNLPCMLNGRPLPARTILGILLRWISHVRWIYISKYSHTGGFCLFDILGRIPNLKTCMYGESPLVYRIRYRCRMDQTDADFQFKNCRGQRHSCLTARYEPSFSRQVECSENPLLSLPPFLFLFIRKSYHTNKRWFFMDDSTLACSPRFVSQFHEWP